MACWGQGDVAFRKEKWQANSSLIHGIRRLVFLRAVISIVEAFLSPPLSPSTEIPILTSVILIFDDVNSLGWHADADIQGEVLTATVGLQLIAVT